MTFTPLSILQAHFQNCRPPCSFAYLQRPVAQQSSNIATVCRESFIPFSDSNRNGRSSLSTNARTRGHNSKTPFVKPSPQSNFAWRRKVVFTWVDASISKHFLHYTTNYAKKFHLFFNCLKGHNFNDCKSTKVCQQPGCMNKHHTLLHVDRYQILLLTSGIRPNMPVTVSSGVMLLTSLLYKTQEAQCLRSPGKVPNV